MKANIRKLEICMAKARINQKDLSKMSNISERALSFIMNGGSCRTDTIGRIAAALEIDVENIIE